MNKILGRNKILLFYILSLGFIAFNAYFLLTRESIAVSLLPFLLLIVMFGFFSMDKLVLLTVALVPLSVPLQRFMPNMDFNMALPTEPILFGILLIFFLKQLLDRDFEKSILYHPVSIVIYINLSWMVITSISSTIPWVSFKYVTARLWFIVAFYLLLCRIFKSKKHLMRFAWIYLIPLLIVILYTIFRHAGFGFTQKAGHFVMVPFFNDHTSYGATLAMFLPIITGMLFMNRYKVLTKYLIAIVLSVLVVAIILSYTRAAWVSIAAAIGVWVIIRLRIKYYWVVAGIIGVVALFFVFQTDIMLRLEQNRQDSSTDIKEHVQSISNVATDASNLERINRWKCAFRMFKEKPFLGWGPGTYQFEYAPFQRSYEKTIISTNAGDMGNAHSEYFGPFSESGVLGMLSFIAIVIMVYITGLRAYRNSPDKDDRTIILGVLCGLTTFFVHGFLNNFLDTDKASAPFWGFIAILVAYDLYHTRKRIPEKND